MTDDTPDRTHQLWVWAFEGNGEPPARTTVRANTKRLGSLEQEMSEMRTWQYDYEKRMQLFMLKLIAASTAIISLAIAVAAIVLS